ncbi:hypothetical protein J1N35_035333, partial [Gossypium stocksii]
MSSIWLREEKGSVDGNRLGVNSGGYSGWRDRGRSGFDKNIDLILGFNLEGKRAYSWKGKERKLLGQFQSPMDHDLENEVIMGKEGKKRARGDIEDSNSMGGRHRRISETTQSLSAAAKRQADR